MVLTFEVKKSPETVFNCLTDISLFVKCHPVITSMQLQHDNSYLVHETLKFGFVPISFRYHATIDIMPGNKVKMHAVVAKFTHIEMFFVMHGEDGETYVVETITIKSPLPIAGLLQRIFKKQHTKLFDNIESCDLTIE